MGASLPAGGVGQKGRTAVPGNWNVKLINVHNKPTIPTKGCCCSHPVYTRQRIRVLHNLIPFESQQEAENSL